MRILRTGAAALSAALIATTIALANPTAAFANDGIVTNKEALAAIAKVDARNNGLIADASPSSTDADSAAQTAAVDIPVYATTGITMKAGNGQNLTIGLPGAKKAGKGVKGANGVVSYAGKDGSTNAASPTKDGSVQSIIVIGGRTAPTTYDFKVGLPKGGKISLVDNNTSAIINDAQGQLLAVVAAPWAQDANHKPVKTYFTTTGTTLTQHVAHKAPGVAYPVVADPFWIPAAVVVAAFTSGVYACGLGYLAGMAWQIFWNGWVWLQVRQAGREGCVEGVVARFLPISLFRKLIKR